MAASKRSRAFMKLCRSAWGPCIMRGSTCRQSAVFSTRTAALLIPASCPEALQDARYHHLQAGQLVRMPVLPPQGCPKLCRLAGGLASQ